MSRVYILYENDLADHSSNIDKLVGVVTNFNVAQNWASKPMSHYRIRNEFTYVELDDPELLNRIAKETK